MFARNKLHQYPCPAKHAGRELQGYFKSRGRQPDKSHAVATAGQGCIDPAKYEYSPAPVAAYKQPEPQRVRKGRGCEADGQKIHAANWMPCTLLLDARPYTPW